MPFVGLATGLVIASTVPTHTAVHLRMFVLDPRYLVHGSPNDGFVGRLIIDSTCGAAREVLDRDIDIDCRDPLNLGPGTGSVRLEARSVDELVRAQATFEQLVLRIHVNSTVTVIDGPRSGRPTWARTAPVWATVLLTEAALLVPPLTRRRRGATLVDKSSWDEVT